MSYRCALIGVLLAACGGGAFAQSDPFAAQDMFRRGRAFERAGNMAQAYLLYSQAAAADPERKQYWQRAQALQRKAAVEAKVMPPVAFAASAGAGQASPESAVPPLPPATEQEIDEARRPQPPAELDASKDAKDLDLRGDARLLWEQVTKTFGLDLVFDGDYQPGQPMRFRVSDVGYREALHALMSVTSSFVVPVSPKLILVVKDTEQKRREVENTIAVTVPIPEPVSIQDAQEMARSVQQLMEIQRFAIDSGQRLVLIRDRVSKVIPARALLIQLLQKRPQLMIEAELVVVPKKTTLRYGLGLPFSFPIIPLIKTVLLSGGPLSFGLGLGSANLVAEWTKSTGKTLLRADIRSVDGLPATFHAGEKYPIITLGYVGQITPGEDVYMPPPNFNFEDLGLSLKITPRIHDSREVTLEVEAEYKLLGNTTASGNPVIASRKFANRVRLGFDQSAIIAGLVSDSASTTLSGAAGIPVIGAVLGRTEKNRDQSETLLILRPRLLTTPPTEMVSSAIWIGAESRMRTPL